MLEKNDFSPPFFNIGGKAYKYGQDILEIAQRAEELSQKYQVDIVLSPQPTDIRLLRDKTEVLKIFAQHIDPITAGRGHGSILPEAVKDAGADGVVLNHAEDPSTIFALHENIKRAQKLGLLTIVCVDSVSEAAAVAEFSPDIIMPEPAELIGTKTPGNKEYIKRAVEAIKKVNEEILVQYGAGISNGEDVFAPIEAGAEGVGASSGIMEAEDPLEKLAELIQATQRAWAAKS